LKEVLPPHLGAILKNEQDYELLNRLGKKGFRTF